MRIGAAIVHYRFWPEVRVTLDALLEQTRAAAEVVVVENGSEDASAGLIRDAYPSIDVIEVERNVGPAAGMNIGLRALLDRDFDAILLLTHETKLAPTALQSLTQRLEAKSTVGAVGPLLGYLSDPDRLWSAGGDIDRRSWDFRHRMEPGRVSEWAGRPPHSVDWLDGACLLLRASAAREAGPFPEDYFMLLDDVEYLQKLKARGWEVECVPEAVAWQEPGRTSPYTFTRNRLGLLARLAPRRYLAREIVRVLFGAARDSVSPRRGHARGDVRERLRGLLHFARRRMGRPPLYD